MKEAIDNYIISIFNVRCVMCWKSKWNFNLEMGDTQKKDVLNMANAIGQFKPLQTEEIKNL